MEELHYMTEDGLEIEELESGYIGDHTARYAAYIKSMERKESVRKESEVS